MHLRAIRTETDCIHKQRTTILTGGTVAVSRKKHHTPAKNSKYQISAKINGDGGGGLNSRKFAKNHDKNE